MSNHCNERCYLVSCGEIILAEGASISVEMDWSENNSCIKCDKSGNLLVCSENGCPLALHEGCLGFPARLDDEGRFYCPYCLYKGAIAELRRARECASTRKNALLIFMNEKSISSEKDMEVDNGHNQSKTSDTNVHITLCDDDKSKYNNNGTIDQSFPLSEEEKIEEGSEDSAGSKAQDASLEMNGENGDRTAEEKQVQEEEHETSGEEQIQEEECETLREEQVQEKEHETSGGKQIEEEDRETSVEEEEEEKIPEEEPETSSASMEQDPSLTMTPRAKRLSNRRKPVDKDSEAVPMQSEPIKNNDKKQTSPSMTPTRRSARRSLPDSKMVNEVKKEFGSPKRLIKPEKPSNRL